MSMLLSLYSSCSISRLSKRAYGSALPLFCCQFLFRANFTTTIIPHKCNKHQNKGHLIYKTSINNGSKKQCLYYRQHGTRITAYDRFGMEMFPLLLYK
jgi:hypothetical protein